MATEHSFVQFIADQIDGAGEITFKKMFGEYGIWSDGKFFAIVAENKLFIKPTKAGKLFAGEIDEAPPYEGAKNYFLIEDKVEDRDWLSALVQKTVAELPAPKPKKKKTKK